MTMSEPTKGTTTKRVYAIRHGQSEFNVLFDKTPPPDAERYHPTNMKKIDCDITERGKEQSRQAGRTLVELLTSSQRKIDFLMISPLRRALQTATHLLEAFPENHNFVVEISNLCTEILLDSCDIGTEPRALAKEFPQWDFSSLETYWWYGGLDPESTWTQMQEKKCQETEEVAERRMGLLKNYLGRLDGETIVVICHSDVIWWLTSEIKNSGERCGTYPKNGEIVDITRYLPQL
ncbi:histidine phosphatase superfamily protein [Nitzschia inconspicua]|uniref:Histidine phosphatase superfamily protein n=1 Tax=Nitzschia inconspicua TaxID=303405 RepID=A0A9K3LSD3_9STRA|nr:histidine phosphatase superfamily protein [Nitzschia inconspicua]